MYPLISYYLLLLVKYFLLFFYFYFVGRGVLLLINKTISNNKNTTKDIMFVKKEIYYPLVGIAMFGNILIVINYFVGLKNPITVLIAALLLFPNFIRITSLNQLTFNLRSLIYYGVIPAILIISSYDTSWHYDAGYYHLNQQNLLRESNMIIGTVNIFWAFGMSSIYEYISAFLWIDKSFILIHFMTLIFIQTLYIYLISNLENNQYKEMKYASYLLLAYSLLDNVGINGGRNGFLYIQGVTKQDIPVAILMFMIGLSCLLVLKYKKIEKIDIFVLFLISLFLIQIKLSSVVIGYLLIILCIFIYRNNIKTIKDISFSIFPILPFLFAWLIKGYLTTGCFLFPLSATCINNFEWYPTNSTRSMENVTTTSSYGLIEYLNQSIPISEWWVNLISFKINFTVIVNFLISFIIIYVLKTILFRKQQPSLIILSTIFSFLPIYLLYLFLYGPTPRYAIGFLMLTISSMSFFIEDMKFKINNKYFYILYLFSIILLVRGSSYQSFISGKEIALFDPVPIAIYQDIDNDWVIPTEGDQCWINLKCTMEKQPAVIVEGSFFKTAYKK